MITMTTVGKLSSSLLGFTVAATLGMSAAHAGHHDHEFMLESPDISSEQQIASRFEFDGFGCNGDNRSPVLRWSNAPEGTKSFAISVYDPDAPTGSGWWHWRVVNIAADTSELSANAGDASGDNLPAGARQITNDYGYAGWGGMCPPPGDEPHRYIFTVHALDTEQLELPDNATSALAGFMINNHEIAKASFMALYGREE